MTTSPATNWNDLPLTAHSQPCALCCGPTESREILPGDRSNYCPRCGAWTASSDGREAERRQRYVDIAWPIAARLARDTLRRGAKPNHTHSIDPATVAVPARPLRVAPRRGKVTTAPGR